MIGVRAERTFDGITYTPGKRFRVIRPGASLRGMKPDGPGGWRGERRELLVGDVITCTGYGRGWGSDPGYGIEWEWEGHDHVDFWPAVHSIYSYRPSPGWLEPVDEDG